MGRSTRFGHRKARAAVALIAGAGCVVVMAASGGAVASASAARSARTAGSPAAAQAGLPATFWPAYLNGPSHTSYNPTQTSITTANATTLGQAWSQTAGAPFVASPTVVRGSLYIGGADGWFYRLSVQTGQVLAKVYLGKQAAKTCPATGMSATATVARDPRTHALTVYVAGGDGYLYALGAMTLAREWRSVIAIPSRKINNYYDWSSPTVANGKIYIGVASSCDVPLIRGAVLAFRQATGARLAAFYTVPRGDDNAGGSVWSSIAVGPNGDVFATTGNGPVGRPRLSDSESILKLDPNTLALLGKFQIPVADLSQDADFGGSPVLFGGYVGACDKNGYFYALRQSTMKLVWKQRIGHPSGAPRWGECLAAPVYDGTNLYFGGNQTTLAGLNYKGSVQARSPSTGALIWATGLPGDVMGSPSMDGGGVIAVGAYYPGTTGVWLVNAATGAVLEQLMTGATFAQSVFAEDRLFCATSTGVYAWTLPTG